MGEPAPIGGEFGDPIRTPVVEARMIVVRQDVMNPATIRSRISSPRMRF
jgi:hypothetical protein